MKYVHRMSFKVTAISFLIKWLNTVKKSWGSQKASLMNLMRVPILVYEMGKVLTNATKTPVICKTLSLKLAVKNNGFMS